MRNRWFHRPLLHGPTLGQAKKVTWLELFYDLVFVAAFIQLGNGLGAHVSFEGALGFAGVFVALWVAWTGFTFFENRYTVDDFAHRMAVFAQMFAVGAMAIGAPSVLAGRTLGFSVASGAAQIVVAGMYLRAYLQVPEARDYARYWGLVFAAGGALWIGAAFLPPKVAVALWAVATLVVLGAPLSPQSRALAERFPLDFEHLAERYGLLTLIVLGESFVKVLGTLVAQQGGLALYAEASVVLLITCGLWWVYFDDVAGSRIRTGRGQWVVWLYAHVPLQAAITAVGVALTKAVHFGWNEPAPDGYRWLLAGSLSLVYFSVAAVDSVTERRQAELDDRTRVNVRWASGLLVLVLAPAGRTMSGGVFLAIVTALVIAQVVFDMILAPFEAAEHMEIGNKSTAELTREWAAGTTRERRRRRGLGQIVRKGTPASLRRDLYFYFIEGSWTRVFGIFAVVFVLANTFFAALYTLEPGSIAHARPASFADAFFFSVQTMSTIGYGVLSPATDYGNVVVAFEAAGSLIGVAIATGLVFAKVSRPKASVLFSQCMVVTRMRGKPVLMLRAGNARGNEVVEASLSLSVLMDELTPEGHHFRRVHDLPLVRSRTPMFRLSWAVMHEIDDHSPIAGVDWADPAQRTLGFVVTLIGHDGTYGQTIFAQHGYDFEDVRVGERFVDVISELEDGRLMIDYTRFHDTVPDEA